MKVAILSPVWFPVPPSGYGGIEWIVSLLADGLVEAGHDATLFASGDSRTKARLESVYPVAPSEWIGHTFWELRHAAACLARSDEFDVISDHTGLLGLALGSMGRTPFAHTVHGPLSGEPGALYEQIIGMTPHAALISVSDEQRRPKPDLPWVGTCANALDLSVYPFRPERGDYLLFLGRMTADKGAHRAVTVAIESGVPLKLAGKCREPLEQQYFDEFVRPHLSDRIEYVGEVTHGEKVELLQHARATLFPIEWDEPFGLVMIESMACGTPVIATRFGAVPEVIEDGVSGVIVDKWREMEFALDRAAAIDPHVQRRIVEERFSPQRMVDDYVRAYEATIERWAGVPG
ncbi:MAG TPA: glycosyltransferase family 4 protein [Gaiella sp.]|jgi:glycosyltransferase involved in cell wall biosynthesis|nr:glycosyltransferase family 4 protein [Gaiella sp.]